MKITLSTRQLEILRLLAHGEPDKVIAERLGIARSTVGSHIFRTLFKLGAKSREHAVYLQFCQ